MVVFLKVLLRTVTTMITQSNEIITNLQNELYSPETHSYTKTDAMDASDGSTQDMEDFLVQELDTIRSQEIMVKAVSSIFLLLLQWFKLSRTLPRLA